MFSGVGHSIDSDCIMFISGTFYVGHFDVLVYFQQMLRTLLP